MLGPPGLTGCTVALVAKGLGCAEATGPRPAHLLTPPTAATHHYIALPPQVRNKDVGTQGQTYLLYDRPTGRYADCEAWPDKALDGVERRNRDLGYLPPSSQPPQQQQQQQAAAATQ